MAGAPPTQILVMRHAEKTSDPLDPHLSDAGVVRAAKLADFIAAQYGTPGALFAAAPSTHSTRPSETLEPLSKKTAIPIDTTFADQDYAALAQQIFSMNCATNAYIVVCWHHCNIPSLLIALRARAGDVSDPWDPQVFNLIIQMDYGTDSPPRITKVVEPF